MTNIFLLCSIYFKLIYRLKLAHVKIQAKYELVSVEIVAVLKASPEEFRDLLAFVKPFVLQKLDYLNQYELTQTLTLDGLKKSFDPLCSFLNRQYTHYNIIAKK